MTTIETDRKATCIRSTLMMADGTFEDFRAVVHPEARNRGKVIEHCSQPGRPGTAMQLGWTPPSPLFLVRMWLALRRAQRQGAAR